MIRTFWVALAVAFVGGPVAAAPLECQGLVQGPAGTLTSKLTVEDGQVIKGVLVWQPRRDPSSTFGANLILVRSYTDLTSGAVGPFETLQTINVGPMNPPPVDRAIIGVSSNTVSPVFKVWRLYSEAIATQKAGRPPMGVPPGSKSIAVTGMVPFSGRDPTARPLIESLASANTVITSVTDERGTVLISKGLFWLDDRAGAEGLATQAFQLARTAAVSPAQSCKPAQPAANPPP